MADSESTAKTPHSLLVQLAARWLEKSRGCTLVLTEFSCSNGSGETPDAIGWRISQGWSILLECKTSRSDFRRDQEKPSRANPEMRLGQERWYLTPAGLLRPEEIPGGWGLLEAGARTRVALPCPDGPANGTKWNWTPGIGWDQRAVDVSIQARELPFLLSVYRRKHCRRCGREMFRERGGLPRVGSPELDLAPAAPAAPAPGSIITLTESVADFDGEWLPAGLDVVALETHGDGSILVSAEHDDGPEGGHGTEVDAWVHDGEWMQRPEERR